MSTNINVISYNVLSPELVSAHETLRDPKYLEDDYRFGLVTDQLEKFFSTYSRSRPISRPIICLQEVNQSWADLLLPFFENHGYRFVWSRGSRKFNGFMGPAMAWPADSYQILKLETIVIGEQIPKPPEKESSKEGQSLTKFVSTTLTKIAKFVRTKLTAWLLLPDTSQYEGDDQVENQLLDHWKMACHRNNTCQVLTFTPKGQDQIFQVANYHMPCAFKQPLVMLLHAVALKQTVFTRPAGKVTHHGRILAGDFNLKPNSPVFRYLIGDGDREIECLNSLVSLLNEETGGKTNVNEGNVKLMDSNVLQPLLEFVSKKGEVLRSAYQTKCGKEPEFTNRAFIKFENKNPYPFTETLDYLLINDFVEVKEVLPLLTLKDLPEPKFLPTKGIPSDHLPIGAEFLI